MPDGKRNSLSSEGDTDGVNGFYDEELQNATGLRRRAPLNHNSRGHNNLNDRLLKTMVANEIKKALNGEDNKRLVAHHRPVLHSDSDTTSDSEMVVVGVVLNPKQAQNEEVSKAIDMLQRNGVSCVYFTLKDSLQNGSKKDDNNLPPCENSNSSSTQELLKSLISQQPNENMLSTEHSELSPTHKKVSSPTVSTTSDYTSPAKDPTLNDDVIVNMESLDTSCTSTTPVVINAKDKEPMPEDPPSPCRKKRKTHGRNANKIKAESEMELSPIASSPSPPLLITEVSDLQNEASNDNDVEKMNQDEDEEASTENAVKVEVKSGTDSRALRRKKRRKRMYPYVSRRKSRNKRKKAVLFNPSSDITFKQNVSSEIQIETLEQPIPILSIADTDLPFNTSDDTTTTKQVDPYEFEDSDIDNSPPNSFKTPSGRSIAVNGVSSKKRGSKSTSSSSAKKLPQKKGSKRSPRKRLTFSKHRAFSPDITDHSSSTNSAAHHERKVEHFAVDSSAETSSAINWNPLLSTPVTPLESCVQPISTTLRGELPTPDVIPDNVKLVLPKNYQCEQLPPLHNCDESLRTDEGKVNLPEDIEEHKNKFIKDEEANHVAQEPIVQLKNNSQLVKVEVKPSTSEFLVPAPPDDSLHDAPDSMQLRRSSFYSSISRNVRTNLEKYLDGRPQDLKPAKRSKKIKNGFLLHHGDNFPDDPEAPYRLHLATQVLLKLNKRRVKCKPKEDKGKSLLSYLKLQPKRVTRVGKHSKTSAEENAESFSRESPSVFSGEWTVARKYICNICGQVENAFWDMVMHKGEVHPGIVVTHVELSDNPPDGFRRRPTPRTTSTLTAPPPCSKCAVTFNNYNDLHRHIFECSGNAAILEEPTTSKVTTRKKRSKRKRGFKRRISGLPKKSSNHSKNPTIAACKSGEITKRRNSEVFKCEFCAREFKTEGWLKNHVSLSHSLPISIPLSKLSLPTRASISSSRRFTSQVAKPTTTKLCREA